MVGDDLLRDDLSPFDGLAEERFGTGCVATLAQQHVDDLTVLINRPVQVPLLALAKQEQLIGKPAPANLTMASNLGRQQWAEHLRPHQDGPVGDIDAAFGQQLPDLATGQRVREVPAHRRQDDVRWPAIAAEG